MARGQGKSRGRHGEHGRVVIDSIGGLGCTRNSMVAEGKGNDVASTRTMSREVWGWKRRLGTSPPNRCNGIYRPGVIDQVPEKGNLRETPLLLVAASGR